MNFSIKNIPRVGTFEGSSSIEKVLSKITINLYINGAEKPSYTTSIENIDLTRYSVTSSNGENIVDLEKLELKKIYKISGYVYKNASELAVDGEKISSAIVVLSKGSEESARTLTDSTGKYRFEGIESGNEYQLKLLSLDSDNNGNHDYMEKDDFSTFSIEVSDSIILTFDKDLTQSVIDSIETRNVDIVIFTNISTGNTVNISVITVNL